MKRLQTIERYHGRWTAAGLLAAGLLAASGGYSAGSAAALLLVPPPGAADGITIQIERYGPLKVNVDTCTGSWAGGGWHIRQLGQLDYQVTATCRF